MSAIAARPKKKSNSGHVEFLDWGRFLSDALLAESTSTHRTSGWQVEKPSYPEKNYLAQRLALWMARLGQVGLFIESCEKTITVGGTVDVGDQRAAVFSVATVTYVTDAGDATNDDIAANWALAMQTNTAVAQLVDISVAGAVITLRARVPGADFALSCNLVDGGTGDATAVVASVRVAPYRVRLSDEDLANVANLDFVFGSASTEDTGSAGRSRMLFDASKSAFRAGWCDAGEWDNASRGDYSAAWGRTCTAPADYSMAGGFESLAGGDAAVAFGYQCSVSGNYGVAMGDRNTAAAACVAMGSQCVASDTGSVAMGSQCEASGVTAVAMGYKCKAEGNVSIAMGGESWATVETAIALGGYCLASELGAMCTGAANSRTNLRATGKGAKAHGYVLSTVTGCVIEASGDGADAHGAQAASAGDNEGATASGDLSRAHGRGVTAEGDYARAYGRGAVAPAHGEVAHAAGMFTGGGGAAQPGSAQSGSVFLMGRTTNATVNLSLGGTGTEWSPPAGSYIVDVRVVAVQESDPTLAAAWSTQIVCLTDGTSLGIVGGGPVTVTAAVNNILSTDVILDDSGSILRVQVDPQVATLAVRWHAELRYVRVSI